MSEKYTLKDEAEWVLSLALKCEKECQLIIASNILQNLDRGQQIRALSMSGVSPSFSDLDIEDEANDRIFISEDNLTEREIFREGFVDGATWIRDSFK